ncbi:MAG: 1,4-alpha-glucan branching protein domain-containing protein [Candidatus Coatesbacteria bacterium]
MVRDRTRGYLCMVLHGHLPFVRHPEYPNFLEEKWFYEAIVETYIPLLTVFEGLVRDGVDWRLTMSLSPPLLSMFADPLLQERAFAHIDRLVELSEKEVRRTAPHPEFQRTARMYEAKFRHARALFSDQYGRNLANGFRRFQDSGQLEIVTCGATHGFLPLMETRPEAVNAQVQVAVDCHARHLGRAPTGIWLPECGFQPGHDEVLRRHGIRYFFMDAHGILLGSPRPKYGTYAPVFCRSGVAAFGRDLESSKQVWSALEGYPGDFEYRDFYRDIGYDLDEDYVRPYINGDGVRTFTGIKYHRITGDTLDKAPYDPARAREKAAQHAGNFLFNRGKQVEYLAGLMDRKPLIVSPYDAELFGHWWYEGPDWLDMLFRKMHFDQDIVKPVTAREYLAEYPVCQVSTPSMSSWGHKGYNEVWLEGSNDWIYRHLHKAAERMTELAGRPAGAGGPAGRAVRQAARELLLAQSSDWAFIMKTGTHVGYAVNRTVNHLGRFTRIYDEVNRGAVDEGWLALIEARDNVFPEVDVRAWSA